MTPDPASQADPSTDDSIAAGSGARADEATADSSAWAGIGGSQAAAEAVKLMEAVQEWVRRTSWSDVGAHASGLTDGGFATGAPECRLCPVCQLVALVRQTQPEAADHLADALASLGAAARAAFGAPAPGNTARAQTQKERIDIG